ncbi:MAG: TolC family protein [Bacteroidetes bacterium]|nr:TolC family protein [Bacteroidota bacterium]MCH8523294.1 TolC family protein [Balneolales bacterium]
MMKIPVMRSGRIVRTMYLALICGLMSYSTLIAQTQTSYDTLYVSLNEAIEIALVNSYFLQRAAFNVDEANEQIRQARSAVYPQIGGAVSYTRNVRTPNPFAGSDAADLFTSFGAIDWLFYNEQQRVDGNPTLSFQDYLDQRNQGLENAGIVQQTGSNPFAIENQFVLGISATQAIYNGAAFAAIRGAEHFRNIVRQQLERETQTMVQQVRTAYLNALLAQEQVNLIETALQQLRDTERDVRALVEQGLAARFDRNSIAVEVVNLETNLIAAQNGAALATRSLNILLGIPVTHQLKLSDRFESYNLNLPDTGGLDDAFNIARRLRPDVQLVDSNIRLRQEERNLVRSSYFPVLSAFADYAYLGNVPDNRDRTITDENDPFQFSSETRGFFDTSYWNAAFSVGLRMQWNIFDGFARKARMNQVNIEIKRAELDALVLRESIYLEVDAALRNVEAAWKRIQSQQRNIELAELNYEEARMRYREGVGTRLEERQAATMLDQSRLNYLTALHDYLIARGELDTAMGNRIVHIELND